VSYFITWIINLTIDPDCDDVRAPSQEAKGHAKGQEAKGHAGDMTSLTLLGRKLRKWVSFLISISGSNLNFVIIVKFKL